MPIFQEERNVPWSAQQMYDLVADVQHYPEFITWVKKVEEQPIAENQALYILHVGLGPVRESFSTIDTFTPHSEIDIRLKSGPLSKLKNTWKFEDCDQGGSVVKFHIEFEFSNRFLSNMMNGIFQQAQMMMIRNFEKRARQVYGNP